MNERERRKRVHETEATIRVGKSGIEAVVEELCDQLRERDLVKVKFLRAARGASDTDELANRLAEQADADLIETRGHTATYH